MFNCQRRKTRLITMGSQPIYFEVVLLLFLSAVVVIASVVFNNIDIVPIVVAAYIVVAI